MNDSSRRIVLITGGSGFVGRQMIRFFREQDWKVRTLGRTPQEDNAFRWDPENGEMDTESMEGVTAVVHLAGESIANGRWNREKRRRILESRINGTRLIVSGMKEAAQAPSVLVSASGVNAYGLEGMEVDEQSPEGNGFLAKVCQGWEAEALRAQEFGIRTVCLRTGIVLDGRGGVLKRLLPVFRLGMGGRIGTGRQGFPWIAMEDLLRIYFRAVVDEEMSGIVNAVHPQLVDQETFARTLAKELRRPAILPLPAFLVRALFGQMGEETLLADLRVHPQILRNLNFPFHYDNLQDALSGVIRMQFPCDRS